MDWNNLFYLNKSIIKWMIMQLMLIYFDKINKKNIYYYKNTIIN